MKLVTQCDEHKWTAFVDAAQTGYITQSWEWGLLTHIGKMHRLAVEDDSGSYIAAILMIETLAPLINRPYLYAPRGPVCDDPSSAHMKLLLQGAEALAKKTGCFMLKIEPQVPDNSEIWLRALKDLKFKLNPFASHPRRSWMLDITVAEAELLSNMKTTWRYNVNRGLRNLNIRIGSAPEDKAIFYAIYKETAERDHFFIHPKSHYDEMFSIFEANGKGILYIAEYQGQPIAAQVAMKCGPVTTSMFSASSNSLRNMRPNHPLQWTAIRWAKEKGSKIYDFRAIAEILEPDQELYGLYAYKHGYGGYSYLSLPTHDMVYNPLFYAAYRQALLLKRRRDRARYVQRISDREQKNELKEE